MPKVKGANNVPSPYSIWMDLLLPWTVVPEANSYPIDTKCTPELGICLMSTGVKCWRDLLESLQETMHLPMPITWMLPVVIWTGMWSFLGNVMYSTKSSLLGEKCIEPPESRIHWGLGLQWLHLSLNEYAQEMSIVVRLPNICIYVWSALLGTAYECMGSGSEDKEAAIMGKATHLGSFMYWS